MLHEKGFLRLTICLSLSLCAWVVEIPTRDTFADQSVRKHEQRAPLYAIFSIIWQGRHIQDHNFQALQALRKTFPGISFIHFLNAAYFTKAGQNTKALAKQMKSLIQENDSVGLYLNPWKSLTLSAGVNFRATPTFWGNAIQDCSQDCGEEVPLTIYSEPDLVKLVRKSIVLLEEQGLPKPKSFMANGWMSNQHVLNAVVGNGIKLDFSSVPPHLLTSRLKFYPLLTWLNSLWNKVDTFSQPVQVQTRYGEATQLVHSALSSEYWSADELKQHFDSFTVAQSSNPESPLTFHLSIYQESAMFEVDKVRETIQYIFAKSSALNLNIKSLTLPADQPELAKYSKVDKLLH